MRIFLAITIVLILSARLLADTVPGTNGNLSGTILGLRNGMIDILDERHNITHVLPNCGGTLSIIALPKVLDAERAYLDRQYKVSISVYVQTLRDISDPAMQALVQLRLMRALDADGQLTEATKIYLALYAAQPMDTVANLHPANLPPAGSKALFQSAELVERILQTKAFTAAQARPLKLFLLDLYLKANDDRAAALAHDLDGGTVRTADTRPAQVQVAAKSDPLAEARAALAAGRAAEAEKLADAQAENKDVSLAAQAALLKGQALEAQDKTDDACLVYLTLAARHEGDRIAATALLAAATLQKDKRHEPQEAARLAQRILDQYPQSPEALAARKLLP